MKLRALNIDDLPFLYQWENDASSWADSEIHNPISKQLLREYITQSKGDIYVDKQLRLIIEENGETIGCIDLFDFEPRTRKAAIGMYIAPTSRGKGVGKCAVKLLEEYAFNFLDLHMIYAIIAEDNKACQSIYQATGFQSTAVLEDWVLRQGKWVNARCFQKIKR